MKPVVLAKLYCANFLADGTCNGVDFKRPGLKQVRFLSEETACLVGCGQRCRYFETAVMPMKDWDWKPGEGRAFREAVNRYQRKHAGILGLAPRQRKCPDCGTPIGSRLRYCESCRQERNTKNVRKAMRNLYQRKKQKGV